MKLNEGKTDRIIRGIIGLILAVVGIMYLANWWGILLLVIGIILIITAITGFCLIYKACNISTTKKA